MKLVIAVDKQVSYMTPQLASALIASLLAAMSNALALQYPNTRFFRVKLRGLLMNH